MCSNQQTNRLGQKVGKFQIIEIEKPDQKFTMYIILYIGLHSLKRLCHRPLQRKTSRNRRRTILIMHNANPHKILHSSTIVNGYSFIEKEEWKKICTNVRNWLNFENLDRGYVGKGETLITLISIIRNPCVIEAWNKQETSQQREKHS